MARRVKSGEFPKLFKQYNEELGEELKKITAEEVVDSVPRLVEKSPIDTGEFASSWDFEANPESVTLGNFAPHAPIIEFGARPFKPPIQPLLEWAARVLQQPPDDEGKYTEAVRRLAFGTQKKIMEKGMQPHYILTNEVEEINKRIRERVEKHRKEP